MAGDIELIRTPSAAAPGGHYSQGVLHKGILHVSGQLPVRADDSHSVDEP
ncbi:endoribonuclease L-PSP family protein, partial [Pseudomonas syringae pv. actinidiae ICMP 18807]